MRDPAITVIPGTYSGHSAGIDSVNVNLRLNGAASVAEGSFFVIDASGNFSASILITTLVNTDYFEIELQMFNIDTSDTTLSLAAIVIEVKELT